MRRIIIDVSRAELNFMREALETKHINMMTYLDTCEDETDNPECDRAPDITEEEFMEQVEAIKQEAKIFEYKPKKKATKKAPWGYKKDGTPKKRPGRPVGMF